LLTETVIGSLPKIVSNATPQAVANAAHSKILAIPEFFQGLSRGTTLVNEPSDTFALCAALNREDESRWREKP